MQPTALRLTGGHVLTEAGLEPGDLVLEGGRFGSPETQGTRALPAEGLWLLPGLVDLHGDGFERTLAPRRGVVTDLERALHGVETEIAAAGITTAWLAQFWSWEGGMRAPEFAQRLAAALRAARPTLELDLRLQLRVERTMMDDLERVAAFIDAQRIDYAVFNDHVPHARLAEGRTPPRLTGSAVKAGRAPDAHLSLMRALSARIDEVPAAIGGLAADLAARGVMLGAHDDASASERAVWGDLGLHVAEFPLTTEAARAAKTRGEPVVMGAPNVVRGGSHNRGGVSAEALVAEGLVDALASDYHYPSLAEAAFALVERGPLTLPQAWALVSANPARIMGLHDRGRIAAGLRADLIVYDPEARRILGTFSRGQPALLRGRLASGLLG